MSENYITQAREHNKELENILIADQEIVHNLKDTSVNGPIGG